MKRLLFVLPVLALLITSCSEKDVLKGKLADSSNDGKEVYLFTAADFESPLLPIDTTIVENGTFQFLLDQSKAGLGVAYIAIKDPSSNIPSGIPFVYEKGTINMNIDSIATVTGTPMNDKTQKFFDKLNEISQEAEKINQKIEAADTDEERQQYFTETLSLNDKINQTIFDFVKENIKNNVGEFYFTQFIQAFSEEQFQEILGEASPEYKKFIDDMMGGSAMKEESWTGKQYIDVEGTNPKGEKISLSDYIGKNKLVLIDFWASWCGPCRVEMPFVTEAYEKYKPKGFEIVGISLDEDKGAWVEGINSLNIKWAQMSDLKGWKSDLSAPYGVKSIPFTLLVDQNGNIIAENLRGEALSQKLEELLN